MKLQIAFDFVDREKAVEIVKVLGDFLDIVEVGTPLIIREGLSIVSEMKSVIPEKTILADLKIMDAGEYEALLAFKNGADIVTVLGVASDSTIEKVLGVANSQGKEIMIDLIGVKDIDMQCIRLRQLGVGIICVHTPFDLQSTGTDPLKELFIVKNCLRDCVTMKMAIAGGLNTKNIDSVLVLQPDIVVVGGGIINAPNMLEVAKRIYKKIHPN